MLALPSLLGIFEYMPRNLDQNSNNVPWRIRRRRYLTLIRTCLLPQDRLTFIGFAPFRVYKNALWTQKGLDPTASSSPLPSLQYDTQYLSRRVSICRNKPDSPTAACCTPFRIGTRPSEALLYLRQSTCEQDKARAQLGVVPVNKWLNPKLKTA